MKESYRYSWDKIIQLLYDAFSISIALWKLGRQQTTQNSQPHMVKICVYEETGYTWY